ncbi:MAG: hypothetical protein RR233_05725 [Clostridiales bacterium]
MKKSMVTKILCAAMVLVAVFCLYGCGNKTEITVTGTVKAYNGDALTLSVGDNLELTFDVKKAEIQCVNGIETGNEVTVVYTGKLDGTDTSDTKVLKISDSDTNKNEKKKKIDPVADNTLESIEGKVVDASMNTLAMKTADGTELVFTTTYAELHYKNGILVGNDVIVKYKGKIDGTDTSKVNVVSVYDFAANVVHEVKSDVHNIVGIVTEAANQSITIKDENGDVFTFNTDKAKKYVKNGIEIGNTVTIKYQGSLTTANSIKLKVISITDGDANAAANVDRNSNPSTKGNTGDTGNKGNTGDTGNKGNTGDTGNTGNQGNTGDNGGNTGGTDTPKPDNSPKTINGSVVDATMNNTVIKTDDGTELAFTTGDAEHHYTNGIQVGNAVSITYTGTINGTDTSGVTVISVTDSAANTATAATATTSSVVGTVDEATSKSLLVLDVAGGSTLEYSLDGAKVNCANGLIVGEAVCVTWTGSVDPSSDNPIPAATIDDVKTEAKVSNVKDDPAVAPTDTEAPADTDAPADNADTTPADTSSDTTTIPTSNAITE